ncbi:MAG: hypothetical protein FWC38_04545 [Proteobacteria bacterium]|nr:hypothetical protein [Pseudomonadota bacterium]
MRRTGRQESGIRGQVSEVRNQRSGIRKAPFSKGVSAKPTGVCRKIFTAKNA